MNDKKEMFPKDFDGNFYFTNWTGTEFRSKWNNVEYIFPPNSSVKLFFPNNTPLEVQNIRKKFAKELGEREFYSSAKMKDLDAQNRSSELRSFHAAVSYQPSDLNSYVQRCLEPLPLAEIKSEKLPNASEQQVFHTDDEGKPVTKILDKGESLVGNGTVVA